MKVVVGYENGRKVYADMGPGGGRAHSRGPIAAYGNGGAIVVGSSGTFTARQDKLKGYRAAFRERERERRRQSA